jgi:hypothetical protein
MNVETLNERAARQARQLASRRVTRTPDDRCTLDAAGAPLDHAEKCAWCRSQAPRPAELLVNGLAPLTMEYAQWVVQ